MRLRRLAPSALLLTAAVAAQPAGLEDAGGYVALGGAASERLVLPDHANPTVVAGIRLSRHVDVQLGYGSRFTERADFSREEVLGSRTQTETSALVAGAGVADRLGWAVLRGRLSVGLNDYWSGRSTYRPDSTSSGRPGDVRAGYGLAFQDIEAATGAFVHVALTTSAGLPVRLGVITAEPTVGVAGSVSRRRSGDVHAPGAQGMPYVRLPLTLRVGGVAVTAESTLGVVFGSSDWSPVQAAGRADGRPVLDGALRVDF